MIKGKRPRVGPWQAQSKTLGQEETCPFNTCRCFRLSKKSFKVSHKLPDTPFCFNLNMCEILKFVWKSAVTSN